MNATPTTSPNFITPTNIGEWSDDLIDQFLDGVRYRRMQTRVLYEKTQELKNAAYAAKAGEMFDKKMKKLAEAIAKFDKHLEKLEKAANDVRALRLQMGEREML